jgi:hypothetical protein
MVRAWSDRASANAEYNQSLRDQVLRPLEYPLFALLGGGIIVIGFSRSSSPSRRTPRSSSSSSSARRSCSSDRVDDQQGGAGGFGAVLLLVLGIAVITAGCIAVGIGERTFHDAAEEKEASRPARSVTRRRHARGSRSRATR